MTRASAAVDRLRAPGTFTRAGLRLVALALALVCPPPAAAAAPPPEVVVVLGGGVSFGLAHLGVLAVLRDAGVPIDRIVGSSSGALVGGLYAAGFGVDTLLEVFQELEMRDLLAWQLPPRDGLFDTAPLALLVDALVEGRAADDTLVPFTAVAVDPAVGRAVAAPAGSLADAIGASVALPFLFTPHESTGRRLIDGGLLETLPVAFAFPGESGPGAPPGAPRDTFVIAVDVAPQLGTEPSDLAATAALLYRSFDRSRRDLADVLVVPDVGDADYWSLAPAAFARAGEEAAHTTLPALLSELVERGVPLQRPGDPHADHPLNAAWRDRLAAARRAIDARPRPWHVGLDVGLDGLGPAAISAEASSEARLHVGVTLGGVALGGAAVGDPAPARGALGGGALGTAEFGLGYGFGLLGSADAVRLRTGVRSGSALAFTLVADLARDGTWAVRVGTLVAPLPGLAVDVGVRWPDPALDAALDWRRTGASLTAAGAVGLAYPWRRVHADARASIAPGAEPEQDWILRTRLFAGRSFGAHEAQQFSVGPAIGVRGIPANTWITPSVAVLSIEIAHPLRAPWSPFGGAEVRHEAWLFLDAAWFEHTIEPGYAWSVGGGTCIDLSLLGLLNTHAAIDLGVAPASGSWHVGVRLAPVWPRPLRSGP
jgi:predicted acylesterase/phospholipase RssA